MAEMMFQVLRTCAKSPLRSGRVGRGAVRAFTLVEILIVVVILGILASIVMAQFANAFGDAERVAFATDLRAYLKGAEAFYLDTSAYPPATATGVVPTGFENYVDAGRWVHPTPIGGHWDVEFENLGVTSALGVHFDDGAMPGTDLLEELDTTIDDGDLTTGRFRWIDTDRLYFVIFE
ncbi:MAG: type II secretion system protein [Planctomycetota bacterium]